MEITNIFVISVIIKLQRRDFFRNTFGLNMKVSGILAISVIIKQFKRVVFGRIFSLYMKVSSILVISVIIKLHKRVILRNILSVSTTDYNVSLCSSSLLFVLCFTKYINILDLFSAFLCRYLRGSWISSLGLSRVQLKNMQKGVTIRVFRSKSGWCYGV